MAGVEAWPGCSMARVYIAQGVHSPVYPGAPVPGYTSGYTSVTAASRKVSVRLCDVNS